MGEAQTNGGRREVGIGGQVSRKALREYRGREGGSKEDKWVGRRGGIRGEGGRHKGMEHAGKLG